MDICVTDSETEYADGTFLFVSLFSFCAKNISKLCLRLSSLTRRFYLRLPLQGYGICYWQFSTFTADNSSTDKYFTCNCFKQGVIKGEA
jgi:hypothetical protein